MSTFKHGQVEEQMSIGLAYKIVTHRKDNPRQTWNETVKELVPWMNCDTVRSYISKYNRGEIRVRQDSKYVPPRQLDYSVLTEAWV